MSDEVREFKLPDLGEGLTDAEIVQWLVHEGDSVALNQPLVEVETEKAIVEIPSPYEGTVEKTFGEVGARVNVGATLITIRTASDAPQTGRREVLVGYGPEDGPPMRRKQRRIGKRDSDEPGAQTPSARALTTPPVRKLARELGIDVDTVAGTGPDGRVTREDVQNAAAAGPSDAPAEVAVSSVRAPRARVVEGAEDERIPVRAIRRSIAEKMVRSAFSIPHVTEWLQIDATQLTQLRRDLSTAPEAAEQKISPLPIVIKALVAALHRHPLINSRWDEEATEIVVRRAYHVGIATDTERGLLVPVIKDADQLNVFEIATEVTRLVAAARAGRIGPADLTGSTITITNIGSFGMESGTPIINYPECAVLAVGVIARRPWVVQDEVVPRDVMTLALTFDHRIVDGAEAGRFLRYLGDLIEKPARLFGVL
ncbi:MAG: dihydrolipoamide acetyltransferase family protein [Actinomycetota bacterium]